MPTDESDIGTIVWQDLTVDNADEIKDFYSQVVGWHSEPVNMGGYSDYEIASPDVGETIS